MKIKINIPWILIGLFNIIPGGIGRTRIFFDNFLPEIFSDGTDPYIAVWFVTVYLIISGIGMISGLMFLYMGLRPNKPFFTYVGFTLSVVFLVMASTVALVNLYMFNIANYDITENPTYFPIITFSAIGLIGMLGVWMHKRKMST